MLDACLFYRKVARPSATIASLLCQLSHGYYLPTVHRAENTDDPRRLREILGALDAIASRTPVIIPLHPLTAKPQADQNIQGAKAPTLHPQPTFNMITLL